MCAFHNAVVDRDQLASCRKGTPPPPSTPVPCMHLGQALEEGIYSCTVHSKCQLTKLKQGLAACNGCPEYTPLDAPDSWVREKWLDPLRITDSRREPTHALRNLLKGGSAFLVLGGPSANTEPTEKLTERGVWSLAVNNVAAHIRVNAFLCSDPPSKFHDGIWRDPSVMKFIPTVKLKGKRARLRKKIGGEFLSAEITTASSPNTWGFGRRSWLSLDQSWFLTPEAAWGNHKSGAERTGQPKVVQTMLLGLRVLQYLGARKIFLLGCDFRMPVTGPIYSFAEKKNEGGVSNCNDVYKVLNKWLHALRPVFERFGFYTYNTNQHSRLTAFEYVPFEHAVDLCKGENFPEVPLDTDMWYDK